MNQAEPPRPLEESYWVIPGRLLAGEYPGRPDPEETAKRLGALLTAGLNSYIDLTVPGEQPSYLAALEQAAGREGTPIWYRNFPIPDFGLPEPARMREILDAAEADLTLGRNVYVHCRGGIGRTGLTVGCYLVRQGLTGDQALARLADWWRRVPKSSRFPQSPETSAQADFVRSWQG